jgi:hypothetical protein
MVCQKDCKGVLARHQKLRCGAEGQLDLPFPQPTWLLAIRNSKAQAPPPDLPNSLAMAQKYFCDEHDLQTGQQCGLESERVHGEHDFATEYILRKGETLQSVPRNRAGHPLPTGVQHNILIRCPVHGERYNTKPSSHHVDKKYLRE